MMITLKYSALAAVVQRTLALASSNAAPGVVWVRPDGHVWGTVKATPTDDPMKRVPPDALLVIELEPYHVSQGSVASKADPSPFEAFAKAEPDEPYFTLLGRDPLSTSTIAWWVTMARTMELHPSEQVDEAERIAAAMDRWRTAKEQTDGQT